MRKNVYYFFLQWENKIMVGGKTISSGPLTFGCNFGITLMQIYGRGKEPGTKSLSEQVLQTTPLRGKS